MTRYITFLLLCLLLSGTACQPSTNSTKGNAASGEAVKDQQAKLGTAGDFGGSLMNAMPGSNIYEVNLRQYTAEGTIEAFMTHLPRLKEMGVDILWFMPIHPISIEKRKQGLGSYYAVADYKRLNTEFGTIADFDKMVEEIHKLDMYIIIDWVPNHTGWDHPWVDAHPNWYSQNKEGEIIDPIDPETGKSWGWTDVAALNFDNQEMRQEMINDMAYWVKEHDIDGFRVDVAHNVPNDFHKDAIAQLRTVKPVIMLAESDKPENVNIAGFDMDYGWPFHHLMHKIARGEAKATAIDEYLEKDRAAMKRGYHLHFITNHDENTWAGTEFDRFGDAHKVMAVLTFTFDGIPLIYSGQEAGNKKRLRFFEKDTLNWDTLVYADFYKKLINLKKENQALWNGAAGGALVKIPTDNDEYMYAFTRKKNEDRVVVILNLSGEPQEATLGGATYLGTYNNVFGNGTMSLAKEMKVQLNGWDYLVLEGH